MDATIDFLDHLARESARFADVLRAAPADARVPTCPDWDAQDLLWHLAEVQWFWGTIVRENITQTDVAQGLKQGRPADRKAVSTFYERVSNDLHRVLTDTPPETTAWTWSEDRTVGFIRRRQAHEALIHRVDAEITAGNRTSMDAALSADGVDEALRVMYGGIPAWGSFASADGRTVRFQATDTRQSWFVELGRFTGTDPDTDQTYDEPDIHPAEHDDPQRVAAATITGTAADLDLWLWRRPTLGELTHTGDHEVVDQLESIISSGIN